MTNKLSPTQIRKENHTFRHLLLTLSGDQTASWVLESPEIFRLSQHSPDSRLARGDRLTIISADGNTIYDSCIVVRAESGLVYLSKPLRIVTLEAAALWEDAFNEVIAVGTGFSLKNKKTNHIDSHIHQSVDACKASYQRSLPQQVA
jgi:hypothetical protein